MNDRGVRDSDEPGASETSALDGGDPHTPAGSAASVACDAQGDADACDRRSAPRLEVLWSVDCETEETFLYAAITNISEMGIFVQTTEPLAVGTTVTLRFAPGGGEPFVLGGVVAWVNRSRPLHDTPNPGMGVRFERLALSDRERIVDAIHTIAYLREEPQVAAIGADCLELPRRRGSN